LGRPAIAFVPATFAREHRELHGLWRILTEDCRGYAQHPETRRWRGKLAALYQRHAALAEELARRGYRHASPLDGRRAIGAAVQTDFVDAPDVQLAILRTKGCGCAVLDEAKSHD
jgi:Pyrimidine dimer DNA glycosylase